MLKIAVCDDNPKHLKKLTDDLESYFQARPVLHGQIAAFTSGQSLLQTVKSQGGFDLYLLDVIMPPPDGIQTGLQLRQLGQNGEIIYLSTSKDYAADSYDVRAFFYLIKPVERQKLFNILDRVTAKQTQPPDKGVLVATPNGPRRILLDHILYVERSGRVMRYYCVDATVDTRAIRSSFREMVAPLLSDSRFYLCGASFVLNFQHVRGVNGQTALLDNGKAVPLPRAAAVAFKNAWGRFWLQEEGQ